jgi:DNA repair exonuclease SbcCD ATPase subunit
MTPNQRNPSPAPPTGAVMTAGLLLMTGLIVGVAITYAAVTRPMLQQMNAVRQEMSDINRDLALVAGLRDQWVVAADVSTALARSKAEIDEAWQSLGSIRALRNELAAEAEQARKSQEIIASMASLRSDLETLAGGLPGQIAQLAVERRAIEQVRASRKEMARELTSLRTARRELVDMNKFINETVRQATDVESARQSLGQLTQLKSDILRHSHDIEFARQRTDSILDVVRQLRSEGAQIGSAADNLAKLHELSIRVNQGTRDISGAVETLDLLSGFRTELAAESRKISGMKQSLADIAQIAGSTEQILKAMRPVAQMQDLREQSDADVRAAARAILDRRRSQEQDLQPVSDQSNE